MGVTTLLERLELMRIGDEVNVVFLEPDRSLFYKDGVLLEGEVINRDNVKKGARKLWVTLDGKRYGVTDENGILNPKTIGVTFIRHTETSQVKKIIMPVPTPPLNKPVPTPPLNKPVPTPPLNKPVPTPPLNKPVPTPPLNKPVFRPVPRDPRSFVKNEN